MATASFREDQIVWLRTAAPTHVNPRVLNHVASARYRETRRPTADAYFVEKKTEAEELVLALVDGSDPSDVALLHGRGFCRSALGRYEDWRKQFFETA